jgi:predicted dehydrogenase
MVKALLIGCGNIGAMYDWDNEQVLSHAKAFSKFDEINVDYFDLNKQQASMVADRYNGNLVFDLDKAIQNEFYDIIAICTPTPTHYKFLYKALNIKTPVIICEKPISTNKNEINELINLYSVSESKVLINYFRRFQPSFVKVQDIITDLQKSDELTNVSIRYQRGFINNCSHALDLLQFLFQEEFIPTNFIINRKDFDHFDNDPTISACCDWMNANISILGLYNVNYSNFEIDLYFNKTKILIQNSGNDILFFGMENLNIGFSKFEIQSQNSMSKCIENYMLPVTEKALNLLKNNWEDNFNESILLNKTILNILNK